MQLSSVGQETSVTVENYESKLAHHLTICQSTHKSIENRRSTMLASKTSTQLANDHRRISALSMRRTVLTEKLSASNATHPVKPSTTVCLAQSKANQRSTSISQPIRTGPTSTKMPGALRAGPTLNGYHVRPVADLSSSRSLPSVSNGQTSSHKSRASTKTTMILQPQRKNPMSQIGAPVTTISNSGPSRSRQLPSRTVQHPSVQFSSSSSVDIKSRDGDNSLKNCERGRVVIPKFSSATTNQTSVAINVSAMTRPGLPTSSKIQVPSRMSKQDASSGGRFKFTTAQPKQSACSGGRLNNSVSVGHSVRQQDKRAGLIAHSNLASNETTVVSKRLPAYKVPNASKKELTTIKLKTMQQKRPNEEISGAKNEAPSTNHEDVDKVVAGIKEAHIESEQNESCLPSSPSGLQNGMAKLSVIDIKRCANGREMTEARIGGKQVRNDQGSIPGQIVSLVRDTTSGQDGEAVHGRLRANYLSAVSISPGPAASLKTSSLLQQGSMRRLQPIAKSLTTAKNDKKGQFMSANISRTTSSSADNSCASDTKQHAKRQLGNDCLSGEHSLKLGCVHTETPKLQQGVVRDSRKRTKHELDTKSINLARQARSSTRQSESTHEILSDDLCPETGETRVSSLDSDNLTDIRPIIKGRILPKPMGHQVLSLMMLDAGLLPAGKDTLTNDERQSHVCLQSEPNTTRLNCLTDITDQDTCYYVTRNTDNDRHQPSYATRDQDSTILAKNMPDTGDDGSSCKEPLSHRDHSRSDMNQDIHTSISLPSSPRAFRSIASKRAKYDLSHDRRNELSELDFLRNNSRERSSLKTFMPLVYTHEEFKITKKTARILDDCSHEENCRLETDSVASSCSSLTKNCPPMLFLSDHLDSVELSKIIQANTEARNQEVIDLSSSRAITQSSIKPHVQSQSKGEQHLTHSPSTQIDRVPAKQSLETIETVCEDDPSDEIVRSTELRQVVENASVTNGNKLNSTTNHYTEAKAEKSSSINSAPSKQIPIEIMSLFDQGKDHPVEFQQSGRHPRSNSVSGQEFHYLSELPSHCPRQMSQAGFGDPNQFYNQKMREYNSKQFNQNLPQVDRSMSPMNLTGRQTDFYLPKRSSSIKYSHDSGQTLTRSQIHASLECLNSIYSENCQQNARQLLSSSHQTRQYGLMHNQTQQQIIQHASNQNNPYATYVLAAAPMDAVINQNADQDLAAAAMATPPSYDAKPTFRLNPPSKKVSSNKQYNSQTEYNARTTVPMSQSPLHRRLVNGPMTSTLNQITSSVSNSLKAGHSSLSLASSAYLIEEKLQTEIKQLQSELKSEREKNQALSSQLDINSNLMAAFEQSLTTLNNRLRQMTTLCEKKDKEILELNNKLDTSNYLDVDPVHETSEKSTSPICPHQDGKLSQDSAAPSVDESQNDTKLASSVDNNDPKAPEGRDDLIKTIDNLRRQLVEKDRLLTDTRLEALSAAHQLEQLESRLNGEQGLLANDDDLDEGVMVANHSPSESDAITESANPSDQRSNNRIDQMATSNHQSLQNDSIRSNNNITLDDLILFTPTRGHHTSSESQACGFSSHSNISNDDTNEVAHSRQHHDNHSDQSSSDFHDEDKSPCATTNQSRLNSEVTKTNDGQFEIRGAMNRMMGNLYVSN